MGPIRRSPVGAAGREGVALCQRPLAVVHRQQRHEGAAVVGVCDAAAIVALARQVGQRLCAQKPGAGAARSGAARWVELKLAYVQGKVDWCVWGGGDGVVWM